MRPIASLDNGEKAGQVAGSNLGRMRSLSAADVLGLTDRLVPAVRSLTAPRALGPVNDGWVLQGDERKTFASGRAHSVPLIVGGNADEGRSFIRSWPIHTVSEFNAFVEQNFAQATPAALQVWTAKADQDVPDALSYMFADTQFNFGVRGMAREQSRLQPKTYRYLFARSPNGEQTAPMHTEELPYVFDNLTAPRFVKRSGADTIDKRLSDQIMDAWVRFAATGDPNGPGLPTWPLYHVATDPYLEFGNDVVAKAGYRNAALDFVHEFLDSRGTAK
jgi:para-nitrobenzyl esterase